MATNILASRLAQLVQTGMLEKKSYATEQRKAVYGLTEKGLAFMPSLLEVANGCAQHDPQTGAPPVWIALVKADKAQAQALIMR